MAFTPSFVKKVGNNIHYWHNQLSPLTDQQLALLEKDRFNIVQAVEYGLRTPETISATIELILSTLKLIEQYSHWREWIPIVGYAEKQATDTSQQLKLQIQLGYLHRLDQKVPQAIEIYHQALLLAESLVARQEIAEIHFHLGTAYYLKPQIELAQQHADQSWQLFQQLPTATHHNLASILNLLGLIVQTQGNLDQAADYFQKAITHWQQTDRQLYLARTWNNLGLVYRNKTNYSEALHCLAQAKQFLTQTHSESDLFMIDMNQAATYYKMGQMAEAVAAYRSISIPYLYKTENFAALGQWAISLGMVLLKQKRSHEAHSLLQEAVGWCGRDSNELNLSHALGTLGEACYQLGNMVEATKYYQAAIDIAQKYPKESRAQELRQRFADQLVICEQASSTLIRVEE